MAIRISKVESSKLSDDNKEVIVASTGKYTGELELRFALECVDQLIDLLGEARDSSGQAARSGPASGVPAPAASRAVPSPAQPIVAPKTNPDEVRFEIPRSFTVTADTSGRGLVLMIVNHRLENQNGYAFAPDAARQIAGGLVKSAEAVLAAKNSAASPKGPPV